MKRKISKCENNIKNIAAFLYADWVTSLDDVEMFIYMFGVIGCRISKRVCLDKEDIESIGGTEALQAILKSIEEKAERLKMYPEKHKLILKVINRVRKKFIKSDPTPNQSPTIPMLNFK
jgi:hypothetical protein